MGRCVEGIRFEKIEPALLGKYKSSILGAPHSINMPTHNFVVHIMLLFIYGVLQGLHARTIIDYTRL